MNVSNYCLICCRYPQHWLSAPSALLELNNIPDGADIYHQHWLSAPSALLELNNIPDGADIYHQH